MQGNNSNVTSVIDDIHGAKNITEHFKTIYENLYNEQEDIDEDFIDEICDKVANTSEAKETISLFSADLMKSAVKKLKPDKSDVTGNFTSDCLKNAPDIFFANSLHCLKPLSPMVTSARTCLSVLSVQLSKILMVISLLPRTIEELQYLL